MFVLVVVCLMLFFCFKQKTAYEMRISDWSSDGALPISGPDFDGCDAVHTHMTNARLTDPEVLEFRFPVLLESFRIRRGSGGKGRHKGGDGTIRRMRFLVPMTATLLSSHRTVPPFGLEGGETGETGKQWVERAKTGEKQVLAGRCSVPMPPGDVFVIAPPSGGGFGKAAVRSEEH